MSKESPGGSWALAFSWLHPTRTGVSFLCVMLLPGKEEFLSVWLVLFLSQLASSESATYFDWYFSLPVGSQIKTSGWWKPSLSWPRKKLWHPRTKKVNFCGLSTCLRVYLLKQLLASALKAGFLPVWQWMSKQGIKSASGEAILVLGKPCLQDTNWWFSARVKSVTNGWKTLINLESKRTEI